MPAAPSTSAPAAAPKPGELDFLADGMANPQQQQQQQDGFGEPAAFGQDGAPMGQPNPYGMYPQGPYAGPTGAYPGEIKGRGLLCCHTSSLLSSVLLSVSDKLDSGHG